MSNAPRILVCPRFIDWTRPDHKQAKFQFSGSGELRVGVVYVTETLTADREADIRRAAKKAAKRFGTDEVTIHAVGG